MNVALFGKRVVADMIKDLKMKASWIIQVGPKSGDNHPYKKQKRSQIDTKERRPCEDGVEKE